MGGKGGDRRWSAKPASADCLVCLWWMMMMQAQIRVPIRDLVGLLRSLVDGSKDWPWAMAHYPVAREGGEEEEEEDGAPSKAASTAATVVESTGRGKFSRPNPPIATN